MKREDEWLLFSMMLMKKSEDSKSVSATLAASLSGASVVAANVAKKIQDGQVGPSIDALRNHFGLKS